MSPRTVSVLVIAEPSNVWGAQLRLMDLAGGLRDRGIILTLASAPTGPLREHWEGRGFPFLAVDLPIHSGLRRDDDPSRRATPRQILAEMAATWKSVHLIRQLARRFDLVLSFSLASHFDVALAGLIAWRPTVIEVVDMVQPGVGHHVLRTASRLASITVVNSMATATALGPLVSQARVIHPGVDVDRFRPGAGDPDVRASLGIPDGSSVVGIVGRVDEGKGVDVLLQAMSQLSGSAVGVHLVVVGDIGVSDFRYLGDLRFAAQRLLGPRVTFAGRRADIPEILRCFDVLVNASIAEPFGRSILEAQASGIAVIGTRSGGVPEFVDHERTGLLVAPSDPDAVLTAALQRVLVDAALRQRLGEAGRQQAQRCFDINDRYDLVADTYRRLVSSPATVPGQR